MWTRHLRGFPRTQRNNRRLGNLTDTWKPGNGFLFDREERLVLTANRLVDQKPEVEFAFSIVENGKVLTRKFEWLSKAKNGKTVKGRLLIADPDRDLAVVQLDSVPDTARTQTGQDQGGASAAVRFLGAGGRTDVAWSGMGSNVEKVSPCKMDLGNNKTATNQMIELAAQRGPARAWVEAPW